MKRINKRRYPMNWDNAFQLKQYFSKPEVATNYQALIISFRRCAVARTLFYC